MKKIKWTKILLYICMTVTALAFVGCADLAAYDKNEKEDHVETLEQENEDSDQKKEEVQDESAESGAGSEIEAETDSETEKENITDHYEPIPVSQMDYDSFQSRMTEEEWAGFQQYFPVLKENKAFEVTDYYGGYTRLNKNGEVVEEEEHALFYRWDSKEVTDISHYVAEFYGEDNNEEMMVYEVKVFDLDEDGIQELIMEWGYRGDILILHYENEKFYGWESVYRGFLMIQTNGIYIGSGGADWNSWNHLRFDHGSWVEEKLAEAYQGEYFIGGEAVEEDIFWQQIDAYETENVTGYEPENCCFF